MTMVRVPKWFIPLVSLIVWAVKIEARPLVRQIRSTHEFERLLQKHATETGLPVIADFYSDGCGPCRMMAPIFKKLAQEIGQDKAVFVKIDTTAQYELSSKYQIRSLPTFVLFLNGKKWNQFSGAGEAQLRQLTQQIVRDAEIQNVLLTMENLVQYYKTVDSSKSEADIETVYKKCATMLPKGVGCAGQAANQLARRLKQKYKTAPKMDQRFTEEAKSPGNGTSSTTGTKDENTTSGKPKTETTKPSRSSKQQPQTPNLHLATKEQLQAELEKRLDAERDAQAEVEDDDEAEDAHSWTRGDFPEKVVIVGGGPAGMSAAIYAARANLQPLVIAPPMGGQLQGKGVDVENYPGLHNMTGPGVVAAMRQQAADFGAVFETDLVVSIDASSRPFKVYTNGTDSGANSTMIETHTIIIATGAESNWLGVKGEYELRGAGVSACATCDGAIYRNKHVVVVGGGDSAMEDALVLARTSSKVVILHRRDEFRASKILAQRVLNHPTISVRWNTVVTEIVGKVMDSETDTEEADLDQQMKTVKSVKIQDVVTGEESELITDAVFVAIGHTPTTKFLEGVVEFDENHPGYLKVEGRTTKTSVPGIFAAGDVSDAVYRQAITSAGSGSAAALDAERYLSEEGLGNEAAELEAELMAELSMTEERVVYNAYSEAGGRVEGMKESISAGEL